MEQNSRIDKWLWEVRIFKTRNQATLACKAGKVRMAGVIVKPSREVKEGEEISVFLPPFHKTVRVIGLPKSRVSAKLVADYMVDLTPAEEYNKLRILRETNFEYRERGLGRPTKRERRDIEYLKKTWKD
jgi:ribosome-associated heat shock protein Hsp15